MKFSMLTATILFGGLLAGTCPSRAEDDQQTDKALEGTWVVLKSEIAGAQDTTPPKEIRTYTFSEGKLTIKDGDKTATTAPFQTDPTKTPKVIDFDFPVKDAKDNPKKEKSPGIYKVDGDTLVLCHTVFGFERPKDFSAQPRTFLITMKREKSTKK